MAWRPSWMSNDPAVADAGRPAITHAKLGAKPCNRSTDGKESIFPRFAWFKCRAVMELPEHWPGRFSIQGSCGKRLESYGCRLFEHEVLATGGMRPWRVGSRRLRRCRSKPRKCAVQGRLTAMLNPKGVAPTGSKPGLLSKVWICRSTSNVFRASPSLDTSRRSTLNVPGPARVNGPCVARVVAGPPAGVKVIGTARPPATTCRTVIRAAPARSAPATMDPQRTRPGTSNAMGRSTLSCRTSGRSSQLARNATVLVPASL